MITFLPCPYVDLCESVDREIACHAIEKAGEGVFIQIPMEDGGMIIV